MALSSPAGVACAPMEVNRECRNANTDGTKTSGGHRCTKQTSDDSPSRGAFCSSSITEPSAAGNHADNHGQSRHNDRAEASRSRFDGCRDGIAMMEQSLLGEGDDQNAVCRGHTHAHDGSHQSGNAERRVGIEKKQDDAGQRRRQGSNDNEGVKPRLKVHDDQQIDQKRS